MGLTTPPKQENLIDVYPEGTPFVIQKAWVEGVVPTQYGDRTMAKVLVSPVGGGTPQEFAVWGSLCEQVQQVEEGDVPAAYKIVKDGKRYLFEAADVDASLPGGATAGMQASAEGEAVPAEQAGLEAAQSS